MPPISGKSNTFTWFHKSLRFNIVFPLCHSVRYQILHLPLGFTPSSLYLLPFINSTFINFHFFNLNFSVWLLSIQFPALPSPTLTCDKLHAGPYTPHSLLYPAFLHTVPLSWNIVFLTSLQNWAWKLPLPSGFYWLSDIWYGFGILPLDFHSTWQVKMPPTPWRRWSIKPSAPQTLTHQLAYQKKDSIELSR